MMLSLNLINVFSVSLCIFSEDGLEAFLAVLGRVVLLCRFFWKFDAFYFLEQRKEVVAHLIF